MISLSGQELALSHLGLRDYLLFAPRNSLIGANKEGIISLPGKKNRKLRYPNLNLLFFPLGYLAIQLLGLSVGTIILPPSPSFFRRRQKMLVNKDLKRRNSDPAAGKADLDIAAPRQTAKTATELCSYSIIWWSFLGLLRFFKVDGTWGPEGGVSRRMVKTKFGDMIRYSLLNFFFFFLEVNLPYILWVTAFNTSFLLSYLALDIWISSIGDSGKTTKQHKKKADAPPPVIQVGNPPPLLELINRHSLAIFLLVCFSFRFTIDHICC